MAGRKPIRKAGLVVAATLALMVPVAAQSAANATGSSALSGTSGSAGPDRAAQVADPAKLIDPNMYAAAIEVRETHHFGSITITPVDKSENSKALVRAVLEDQQGLEDLRKAVRGNSELMKALNDKDISVGDVVSVTTDRNNNVIVFVKG